MDASYIFLHFVLPGITFGLAAAAQPGPLLLFLISRTMESGWKKTLPAIFAPLISDGPIALLCLLILGNLPADFLQYIRLLGGIFILYLAFQAVWSWKKQGADDLALTASPKRTLYEATVVNFLNPGPYLGWSLIIGPLFLEGWKTGPFAGLWVLICFYGTMFLVTGIILYLFDLAKERGRKVQHILAGISALFLAIYGIYQMFTGIRGLFA